LYTSQKSIINIANRQRMLRAAWSWHWWNARQRNEVAAFTVWWCPAICKHTTSNVTVSNILYCTLSHCLYCMEYT